MKVEMLAEGTLRLTSESDHDIAVLMAQWRSGFIGTPDFRPTPGGERTAILRLQKVPANERCSRT